MKDNFDLRAYISSKRILNEDFSPVINEDTDMFRLRLRESIHGILTEKKKTKNKKEKIDPMDIDIDSAFTKEQPEDENIPPIEDDKMPMDNHEQPSARPVDNTGNEKPGFSKEEQEIQNSLKVAYDHAETIGDQKLATQIANTLKFFVSTHIVAGQI